MPSRMDPDMLTNPPAAASAAPSGAGKGPGWLAAVEHFVIDLDGTMLLGRSVYPWSRGFIGAVRRSGAGYTFLTNNDLLSDNELVNLLQSEGIAVPRSGLYSAGRSVCDLVSAWLPGARRALNLGTPALGAHLAAAGLSCVQGESDASAPEVVVVGACPGATQRDLARAAHWIARGVPWVSTHPDVLLPAGDQTSVLGAGAVCAALTAATGRSPDRVAGKPDPGTFHRALAGLGLDPARVAVVGDSLDADVALAHAVGAHAILLRPTGDDPAPLPSPLARPALVVRDLRELARLLEP